MLQEVGPTLDVIVFYNGGIFLNHFEVSDRLAVGDVSNMYEIAERQLQADKVLSI